MPVLDRSGHPDRPDGGAVRGPRRCLSDTPLGGEAEKKTGRLRGGVGSAQAELGPLGFPLQRVARLTRRCHDLLMGDARPVLLVHGGWHGAWCWSAVQAALDGQGVASWAIDLPGHGLSVEPLGDLAADADCVCSAMRTIEQLTGDEVVLVGHSYGGGVITEAAARHLAAANSLAHLVYVTAAALSDGESVGGLAAEVNGNKTRLSELSQPVGDGTLSVGPRELVTEVFYSRCSEAAANAAWPRLSRQALSSLVQPTIGDPRSSIESTFIVCNDDRALHPDAQRLLAQRCTNSVELDADHSPAMSAPAALADLIAKISAA
jgi:pimeloyl-ACP methyl ester carboxylesterase